MASLLANLDGIDRVFLLFLIGRVGTRAHAEFHAPDPNQEPENFGSDRRDKQQQASSIFSADLSGFDPGAAVAKPMGSHYER